VIGEPRTHVAECASTQLLLAPDAPEGAIATTDHQTAGRGRLGRRWVEAPGTAVLVSVLLRPPPARQAPELSLVAAVAAAHAVEAVGGVGAVVKWPNDVVLRDRKVAGILAELRSGAVVLGIGINVNQTPEQLPEDTKLAPTSLRLETGREHDRERVLQALLASLEAAYRSWLEGGLAGVLDDLRRRDFLQGRRVTVGDVSGVAAGIDEAGRLRVRTAQGIETVTSGEVVLAAA
jgi:BirA family transcriptional regulator, biotin operon repressor / biotin---[acetyl-CoA-carboxylase] ligase